MSRVRNPHCYPPHMPIVVQKYGGTSVGRPSGSASSRTGSCRLGTRATTRSRWSRRWARPPTSSCRWPPRSPPPRAPGARHAAHLRREDRDVAPRDRGERPRLPRSLLHRVPGRDHHRHPPRPGQDRRDPAGAHQGVARRRQRRDPRRAPGPVDRVRHHDARPGRLGHDGRRDGRALGATACEIYTDVDGVYTRIRGCSAARKIDRISYEEMLELAAGGARVLGLRSVEYARKHGIRLHVRSSFGDRPGTWSSATTATTARAAWTAYRCSRAR